MIVATVLLCLVSNPLCDESNPDKTLMLPVESAVYCYEGLEHAVAASYPEFRIVRMECR